MYQPLEWRHLDSSPGESTCGALAVCMHPVQVRHVHGSSQVLLLKHGSLRGEAYFLLRSLGFSSSLVLISFKVPRWGPSNVFT